MLGAEATREEPCCRASCKLFSSLRGAAAVGELASCACCCSPDPSVEGGRQVSARLGGVRIRFKNEVVSKMARSVLLS